MIASIRLVERMLGDGVKVPLASEFPMRKSARKSLHWRHDVAAGRKVEPADFIALRPGTGLPPYSLEDCVGRTTVRGARGGEMVRMSTFRGRKQ
jgi:sialic acid synthase SpsE